MFVATSGCTVRPFRWQWVRIPPVGRFIIVTEPPGIEVCCLQRDPHQLRS